MVVHIHALGAAGMASRVFGCFVLLVWLCGAASPMPIDTESSEICDYVLNQGIVFFEGCKNVSQAELAEFDRLERLEIYSFSGLEVETLEQTWGHALTQNELMTAEVEMMRTGSAVIVKSVEPDSRRLRRCNRACRQRRRRRIRNWFKDKAKWVWGGITAGASMAWAAIAKGASDGYDALAEAVENARDDAGNSPPESCAIGPSLQMQVIAQKTRGNHCKPVNTSRE